MFREYTNSLNANIYANAARELGFDIKVISKEIAFLKIKKGNKESYILGNILDFNLRLPSAIAKNKYATNLLFKLSFPDLFVEQYYLKLDDKDKYQKAYDYCKSKNYEVVIKPVDMSCGHGVSILPRNDEEVAEAINNIIKGDNDILIEEYIQASNEYRVLIVKNQAVDVLKRIPCTVQGDGKSNIRKLINKENEFRIKHNFALINADKKMKDYLKQQGKTINFTPAEKEFIRLRQECSFDQGGVVVRVDLKRINPQLLKTFIETAKASKLNYIGLDIMGGELESGNIICYKINEINDAAMMDIHYYADLIEKRPLCTAKKVIGMLW